MPTIVCAISLICADFDLGGFAFTIFALISISIFLLHYAFKNGSAAVGARLLRVAARAVATARIVPIAKRLAVIAHVGARERSAILAHELCALGVRRVFLCPTHSGPVLSAVFSQSTSENIIMAIPPPNIITTSPISISVSAPKNPRNPVRLNIISHSNPNNVKNLFIIILCASVCLSLSGS